MIEPVEVLLDLRGYSRRIGGPEGFIALWEELAPALKGRPLITGRPYSLESRSGTISFTVIRNPVSQVSEDTRFAVHSLLEPPSVRYTCDSCQAEGKTVYGPFICPTCRDSGQDGRVCDNHVLILDGAMRSFCRTHAPRCECGAAATFWCQGPECRRRKAWCDAHRKHHRNDPDHAYCPGCYAVLYPDCERNGCANVGTLACEFVDVNTMRPCGRHACPSHMQRWQVYGPDAEGLALCNQHRGVRSLDDQALISQIILATGARRFRLHRSPPLPTLQSIRHILRKARNRIYDLGEIGRLFENFHVNFGTHSALRNEVSGLLKQHSDRRQRDMERDQSEKQQGLVIFERIRQLLAARGQNELAQLVRFSDYRPRSNLIFVIVPDALAGRFIGPGGRNIKELCAAINVDIKLEKTGHPRSGL